jgi:hypothetical protein
MASTVTGSPGHANRTRLLYLLAASHSGSTLLALLLGSHPEIATVGELKQTSLGNLETYRCSCGVEIRRCSFWKAVREHLAASGWTFEPGDGTTDLAAGAGVFAHRLLRPLHRGPALEALRDAALHLAPGWRSHLARWQRANAKLVEAVCRITGRPLLVDSSKVAIRLKYLLRNPALEVRVLRVVRDGRAVMLAHMDPARFADASDERLRGGGSGGTRVSERLPAAAAAHEWRRSTEEAAWAVRGLPRDAWREVRYEDLCADPRAALRPILDWLGVEATAPLGLDRGRYHVVGNGMRLDSTREVRLDDRWKAVLAAGDLATFEAVGGQLNRQLGYC